MYEGIDKVGQAGDGSDYSWVDDMIGVSGPTKAAAESASVEGATKESPSRGIVEEIPNLSEEAVGTFFKECLGVLRRGLAAEASRATEPQTRLAIELSPTPPIQGPKPKTIEELKFKDASNDPLQAFAYAANPSYFQDSKASFAKFKLAMYCREASESLGHRMTDRELLYAVIGRNDPDAKTPEQKVAVGKAAVEQSIVRKMVWSAVDESFTKGGLGTINERFKKELIEGIKWDGSKITLSGLANTLSEHKPLGPKEFLIVRIDGTEIELTDRGLQSIQAILTRAKEFALNGEIQKTKLEEIIERLQYMEGWSDKAVESAVKLLKSTTYDNGLMKGSLSFFRGRIGDFFGFLGELGSAWRN